MNGSIPYLYSSDGYPENWQEIDPQYRETLRAIGRGSQVGFARNPEREGSRRGLARRFARRGDVMRLMNRVRGGAPAGLTEGDRKALGIRAFRRLGVKRGSQPGTWACPWPLCIDGFQHPRTPNVLYFPFPETTPISESGTLHRIDETFLRSEVEAVGFRFLVETNFLRNPSDPRDQNTPDPPQPKDEFILKFVKP